MRYVLETTIKQPREKVAQLMENPENLKHWQPSFQSMEQISGTPGKEGAVARLKYKMGNRDVEMTETIVKNNLPEEFNATYVAKGVYNEQVNRFEAIDANTTRWVSESYFRFSGFMKILGWLMPGTFKKEGQKYLDNFKAFAESQG